jgi:ribosomal protein L22
MTEAPREDEPDVGATAPTRDESVPETPEEAVASAEAAAEIAESAAADAADAETPAEAAEAAAVAADAAELAADAAEVAEAAEGAEADAEAAAEEAAEEAEEKPKPRRRKKAVAEATAEADAQEATAEAEPEAEEAEEAQPAKTRGPRRGSAEAGAKKQRGRRPRPDAEPVFVRAQAKYVRSSPRKARLVVDHIRGKSVAEARAILAHTPRAAAVPVLKVLESAIANAEHNHELLPEELRVHQVMVDEGPTIKRFRPRALGRATKIRKRTSHITINLTNKA